VRDPKGHGLEIRFHCFPADCISSATRPASDNESDATSTTPTATATADDQLARRAGAADTAGAPSAMDGGAGVVGAREGRTGGAVARGSTVARGAFLRAVVAGEGQDGGDVRDTSGRLARILELLRSPGVEQPIFYSEDGLSSVEESRRGNQQRRPEFFSELGRKIVACPARAMPDQCARGEVKRAVQVAVRSERQLLPSPPLLRCQRAAVPRL
jgi:hypothetical protein